MEDLYATLGVSKTATQDEIKKAYRNMAFKYHPDRNPGDKAAEEKFKQVNSAYSVLGDETKRRQYDTYGSSDFSGYSNAGYEQRQRTGTYDYYQYQEGPFGSYGRTGNTGYTGDPFWDFFNDAQNAGHESGNNRYSYTYTNRSTDSHTRKHAWGRLGRGIIQTVLAVMGMWVFGRFSILLGIICLVGAGRGFSEILQSIRYITAEKK